MGPAHVAHAAGAAALAAALAAGSPPGTAPAGPPGPAALVVGTVDYAMPPDAAPDPVALTMPSSDGPTFYRAQ